MGKRGISPLIGAILIIAFTIAIAAVVMFWSAGFIKSTTETATIQTTKEVTCSMEVNLKINSACLEGNSLKYIIDNKGKQDLSGFITRVYATNNVIANETNITIPTLNVMLFRQYITSSLLSSISKIEIVPVITMSDGKKATCKDTVIDYKNIKTCTSESYLLYCKFDSSLTCENGETANSSGLSYTAKSITDTSQSDFAQGVYYNLDIASESGNVLLSRPVTDSNTVLLLHFDGNSTTDSSTYGNNGVLGGGDSTKAPQYTTSGRIGGAYTFDGTNDFINITGSALNIVNAITIEAWAKPFTTSVTQGIVGRHTGANDAGGTVRFANTNVQVVTNIGGIYTSFDTTNNPITANQWHHVVYTYNGSNEYIYINGMIKATRANSGVIYTPVPHTWIGETHTLHNQPFNGTIDEVRILNKALTPAEIHQDYQDQAAGKQLTITDYEGIGNLTSKIFDLGSNPTISSLSWNEEKSWKYKKPITITNTEATPLTNHQVLITLTTSNFNYSKANADGSDIRFLSNSIQLSYWIETWNPAGESKIWVKIPYIAPSSSETIYIYYSNPSASSTSDESIIFGSSNSPAGIDCTDIRSHGSNVNGIYWINPNVNNPFQAYCDMATDGGGWTFVIRNDDLGGWASWDYNVEPNHSSGTYTPDITTSSDFYLNFNNISYDDYLFATGDYAHWLITNRSTLDTRCGQAPASCSGCLCNVRKSSQNSNPHQVIWYYRVDNTEDPWISVTNHVGIILYGEYGYAGSPHIDYKNANQGVNVFIRNFLTIQTSSEPNVNVESEEVLSNITIQTRSGSSNASLGSWSLFYTNAAGEAWKSSNERYAQYLAFLETPTTFITPKLLDLTINYTEGSVSEGVSFENAVYDQGVYIEGADILIYPTTNNLNANEGTIELWVNMSWSDGSAHYILEDSNSVFELYKSSSNLLVFDLFGIQSTYSVSSLSDFHHITITWKANDKIHLYTDGIERDSDSIASIPTIGENLYLGSDSSGSNQLNGVIDELIVSEIKKEFN